MKSVKLINFTDLSLDKKKMVLEWRNHIDVSKFMYSSNKIPLKKHLQYIENLKTDNNNVYFLVTFKDKGIGVVYFNHISFKAKEAFFGLYANPFEKITGVGSILEEICIKYAFDILKLIKLKLEVFSDNNKAINLYKKFNFKETSKKTVNDRDVICMELIKSNILKDLI